MPVAVWDARSPGWLCPARGARTQWLNDHEMPVICIYRIEFYLVDTPFARLFRYSLNDEDKPHWTSNHVPGEPHNHDACAVAEEAPLDVILSDLPPDALL